jgi:hypothetical protein
MKYNISCKQGAVCFYFQKCTARFLKTKQKELHQLREETMRKMAAAKLTTWKKNYQE